MSSRRVRNGAADANARGNQRSVEADALRLVAEATLVILLVEPVAQSARERLRDYLKRITKDTSSSSLKEEVGRLVEESIEDEEVQAEVMNRIGPILESVDQR